MRYFSNIDSEPNDVYIQNTHLPNAKVLNIYIVGFWVDVGKISPKKRLKNWFLQSHGGVPCSRFHQFCSQLTEIPNDFIEMLSLRIVIDITNDKMFSKYLKQHAIGDLIKKPEDIRVYLKTYIRKTFVLFVTKIVNVLRWWLNCIDLHIQAGVYYNITIVGIATFMVWESWSYCTLIQWKKWDDRFFHVCFLIENLFLIFQGITNISMSYSTDKKEKF